jgi:hypothetical protein
VGSCDLFIFLSGPFFGRKMWSDMEHDDQQMNHIHHHPQHDAPATVYDESSTNNGPTETEER